MERFTSINTRVSFRFCSIYRTHYWLIVGPDLIASYASVGYDKLGYIPLLAGGRLPCFTLAVSSFTYRTAWTLCWSWVGAAGEGACYLWLPGVKTRAKQIGRGTTSVPVK